MSVAHFYVPAPNQTDAQDRADALGAVLVSADLATEPRYVDRIPSLPCVVCDHGDGIVVLPEPVTPEQLEAAHDVLLEENIPTTVARTADQVIATAEAIATHTTAVNPHGITTATLGAATPADVDARISQVVGTAPTALDTLNELASALGNDANFASTVTTALAGKAPTAHNHDAAYAPTHSHPYAATSHAHVDADIPAAIARDAEVAAGYSPLGHTHSYEPAGTVATHAAAADPHPTYLTQAEGDARYAVLGAGATGGAMRVATAQTMTATAQTAVTGLSFAAAANATYVFQVELVISTSTGTSPTTAWGFTGPASPTAVGITGRIDTSTSVQVDLALAAFGNFAAQAQVANTGASFSGVVQTGATAGTVQLTAARAGTNPSMVVAAGSNGFWMRVA